MRYYLAAAVLATACHVSSRAEAQADVAGVSPQAVEALHLAESKDPYEQELGFLRLEALREPATAQAITRYADHSSADLRAYSLRALATIQGAAAIPLLLNKLKVDPQPLVRRAALLGLEPIRGNDPDVLAAFIDALRDRTTEVRITAVDIGSRIKDPRAREALLLRNRRERRRDVRRALELAMKRLDGHDTASQSPP